MRLAILQFNPLLGDMAGNAEQMLLFAGEALKKGATIVLTPELSLCGYPPDDWLQHDDFYTRAAETLSNLAVQIGKISSDLAVIVGHPVKKNGLSFNAASVLCGGKIRETICKNPLVDHDFFRETTYFAAAPTLSQTLTIGGFCFAIHIGSDLPDASKMAGILKEKPAALFIMAATPVHLMNPAMLEKTLADFATHHALPVVFCNLLGGQDALVFDGYVAAFDANGALCSRSKSFDHQLLFLDFSPNNHMVGEIFPPSAAIEERTWNALVLGVRDYVEKNRFTGAVLGLSGGMDSALTLSIAVDALGAEKVHALMMPSPYTAQMSLDDSREMVKRLACTYDEIPILPAMKTYGEMLNPLFGGLPTGTPAENIQARIRGNVLMAVANHTGKIVLTTGNKSEIAVGYCTLYGDTAGGLAVLADCYKTMVYRLAAYRNALTPDNPPIPQNIITRAPSAELRPDQCDQDSLPPYEELDTIVESYLQGNTAEAIINAGLPTKAVQRVLQLLHLAEHKRRQLPIGIRLNRYGFGSNWRYPVTSSIKHHTR